MDPDKLKDKNSREMEPPKGHEHLRLGLGVVLGFIFFLVAWSVLAELDSAAVAPGQIDVASENKIIKHLEGGIVEEIFIDEGDEVQKGQILARLVNVQQYSTAQLLSYRLHHLKANVDRLKSYQEEREEPEFSEELLALAAKDSKIQDLLDGQKVRYTSEKETYDGQLALHQKQIEEIEALVTSIQRQIRALDDEVKLIQEEVEGLIILEKEQLVGKPTLLALQRREAELRRQREQLTGSLAQARERISQAKLELIHLKEDRESQRADEMDEHFSGILETMEQLTAAKDRLSRMEIFSPVSGKVVNLSMHTVGGVVGQGEELMEIVPATDNLVIEARINPLDIDVVRPGLKARVQLLPYSQRATLQLEGVVKDVSAHVIVDQKTLESYYLARVEIPAGEMDDRGDIELYPGMPVQVMILTGKRSPLDYLITPIRDSFHRAFLEQ